MFSLLNNFGWRDILDIIIVAFIIYRVITLIKGTGAFQVLIVLLSFLAICFTKDFLETPANKGLPRDLKEIMPDKRL